MDRKSRRYITSFLSDPPEEYLRNEWTKAHRVNWRRKALKMRVRCNRDCTKWTGNRGGTLHYSSQALLRNNISGTNEPNHIVQIGVERPWKCELDAIETVRSGQELTEVHQHHTIPLHPPEEYLWNEWTKSNHVNLRRKALKMGVRFNWDYMKRTGTHGDTQ